MKMPSTASESAVRVMFVNTIPVCIKERLADASPAVGLFMRSKANVGAEELTVKVCSQCLIAETLTTPVDAPVIEMPEAAMLDHAVLVYAITDWADPYDICSLAPLPYESIPEIEIVPAGIPPAN